ncbi:hypothetical protein Tco_0935976 [Tanacetum coccineum]
MQTRSSSKFVGEPSTNPTFTIPKRHNRRRSIQRVEPFSLEETPVDTMADQRTMEQLLQAPTEGYGDAWTINGQDQMRGGQTMIEWLGLEVEERLRA